MVVRPIVTRSLLIGASLLFSVACADDEVKTQEPVVAQGGAAQIPDAPGGDAGQTAEKLAGEGTAGAAATAQPASESAASPQPETSKDPAAGQMMTTLELNVRQGPGMRHEVVRVLKKGEKVTTGSCDTVWCKIGEGEYVSKKYLEEAN